MDSSPDPAVVALTDTFQPKRGVTSREAPGGLFVLDVTTGVCCELNALGGRVFQLLSSGASLSQVFEQLEGEYEVAPSVLERDLRELASELLARGILERL